MPGVVAGVVGGGSHRCLRAVETSIILTVRYIPYYYIPYCRASGNVQMAAFQRRLVVGKTESLYACGCRCFRGCWESLMPSCPVRPLSPWPLGIFRIAMLLRGACSCVSKESGWLLKKRNYNMPVVVASIASSKKVTTVWNTERGISRLFVLVGRVVATIH